MKAKTIITAISMLLSAAATVSGCGDEEKIAVRPPVVQYVPPALDSPNVAEDIAVPEAEVTVSPPEDTIIQSEPQKTNDADNDQNELEGETAACSTEAPTLFISADDSNSQTAPVVVRSLIEEGVNVQTGLSQEGVRPYEFLNYYNISYQPSNNGKVRVIPQLQEIGENETTRSYVLQIGVQAPATTVRRPLNLTFSLDTSGSMTGSGLNYMKAAMRSMAENFRDGDIVSVVVWNESQTVVLDSHMVTGPNDAVFMVVVNSLQTAGSTDLNTGLAKAYELAEKNYRADRLNRVVLISDGGANIGVTNANLIKEHAADGESQQGVYMVGIGCGDNFNESLINKVTDAGKGAAVFLDRAGEAEKMFGERFLENMDIAAMDVRVQLNLPPTFNVTRFFGEEISSDPKEVEPQHLGAEDAMIFSQEISTCNPAGVTGAEEISVDVYYNDPVTFERIHVSASRRIDEMLRAKNFELTKGRIVVHYAEAAGELLWSIPSEANAAACDDLMAEIDSAEELLDQDEDYQEIRRLAGALCVQRTNDGSYKR